MARHRAPAHPDPHLPRLRLAPSRARRWRAEFARQFLASLTTGAVVAAALVSLATL